MGKPSCYCTRQGVFSFTSLLEDLEDSFLDKEETQAYIHVKAEQIF